MYSGKLALSTHTATGVIGVANMLQVSAIEKAAGEFFLSKLDPRTSIHALRFAQQRAECEEHAKAMLDGCIDYMVENFAAMSRDASFRAAGRDRSGPDCQRQIASRGA